MRKSRFLNVLAIVVLSLTGTFPALGQDSKLAPGPPHETNLVIGQVPPDFELTSIDGQSYRLGAQRGQRPMLVVFFRGTW